MGSPFGRPTVKHYFRQCADTFSCICKYCYALHGSTPCARPATCPPPRKVEPSQGFGVWVSGFGGFFGLRQFRCLKYSRAREASTLENATELDQAAGHGDVIVRLISSSIRPCANSTGHTSKYAYTYIYICVYICICVSLVLSVFLRDFCNSGPAACP